MSLRGMRVGTAVAALCFAGACTLFLGDGSPEESMGSWTRQVQALRELPFVRPLEFRWIEREEISGVVDEMITAAYPAESLEEYRDAYAALGVLPPDLDLHRVLLDLQQDQLVGLYDPRRETMYVVTDQPDDGYSTEATIVHELVHALQHQHFPETFAMQQGLRHNDDVVSAIGAAIEGDASLTMFGVSGEGSALRRDVDSAEQLRETLLIDLMHPTGMLAAVPRLMRVSLLFGYMHGTPIAARRYAEAGNAGLDALLVAPPLSTREIVAPEERTPVEFIRLPLESLRAAVESRGCELGHENVAGALTLQVLFEDHATAPDAAADADALAAVLSGWTGDRFLQVSCSDAWELVWLTRWRDLGAAAAFAERYRSIAASIAEGTALSGTPRALHFERTVLVLTPGLAGEAQLVRRQSEIRGYDSFSAWVADDCFTESPCPDPLEAPTVAPVARLDGAIATPPSAWGGIEVGTQ